MNNQTLNSGERLYPKEANSLDLEMRDQFDRYALAVQYAKDAECLDAACGAGYGAKILAGVAKKVLALDYDDEALHHARTYYNAENVQFQQADLNHVLSLESNCFDLVVSFETIEHLYQQEQLVKEFHRILRPGGVLIMSTPNGTVTGLANEPPNPFHVHELSCRELSDILTRNSLMLEALFGQWRYNHIEKPSIVRSRGFKSALNAVYLLARNLKRSKFVHKIARWIKATERFSCFIGQANNVPSDRSSSKIIAFKI